MLLYVTWLSTGTLYELLAMKPEQEQKLLTAIINKLGDPTRKVASRVCYLLGQLGLFTDTKFHMFFIYKNDFNKSEIH